MHNNTTNKIKSKLIKLNKNHQELKLNLTIIEISNRIKINNINKQINNTINKIIDLI